MQLQFKDGVHLDGREPRRSPRRQVLAFETEFVLPPVELHAFQLFLFSVLRDGHILLGEIFEQVFPGVRAARGPADDANHVVEMVERHLVAGQNVLAFAGFAQVVASAPQHHVAPVLDEQANHLEQAHFARLPAGNRQQDHAERLLHLRVLVKVVEDELRLLAALQLDDDAHALAVAFVADIGDAVDLLRLRELGNALDQRGLVHLIGNFGDNDVFAVLAGFLDRGLRAHGEAAAPVLVRRLDSLASGDVAARGEIRPRHELHHFLQRGLRLLDEQDGRVNHFAQVVRRNVGGHADGDAAGSVHEQVRHAGREDDRLFFRLVEVRREIYGFLFDVGEQFLGDARQARFRIAHGCRHVAVNGTEVSLPVHQGITHVKVLRHAHQSVIDRRVSVGVILAEHFADDLRAFAVGPRGSQAQFVHAVENAAMHRLQAVAHVRQRAPDNHGHRVVEIRLLHLGFDIHRKHYG